MSTQQAEVRELREGRYVVIDEEPCKIDKLSTSKPGKHGSAKAKIQATGIFDGSKHRMKAPVDSRCEVPHIDKRQAQVISMQEGGDIVQLMDLETYDTFELQVPEEYKGEMEPEDEISYLEAMGRRKITGT
jgi:translation initiation factor 5A